MVSLSRAVLPRLGLALLCLAAGPAAAQDVGRNAVTLFAGRMTSNVWEDVAFPHDDIDFRAAYLVGGALSRRLTTLFGGLDVELEGQVDWHFGREHHFELNLPLIGRWTRFPWNDTVRTSLAWGLGMSYATEVPPEERQLHGGESQNLLVYWVAELELGPPEEPWSGVLRLHHRSGAFGAVADRGGSNWVVLGVKRRF